VTRFAIIVVDWFLLEVATAVSISVLPHLFLVLTQTPNQALERTADRRVDLLLMTLVLKLETRLALVSGRSACSR
jgi:hypothetical protein